MLTLYGIPNCDTVKKARRWLMEQGIEYRFHDYRREGLDEDRLRRWVRELGWESLLNTRGLAWRRLPPRRKAPLDEARAIELMLEEPALIRRPLLDLGRRRQVGFDPAVYRELLTKD